MILCRVYWQDKESKKLRIIMQNFKDERAIEKYIRSTTRWTNQKVMLLIMEEFYGSEDQIIE